MRLSSPVAYGSLCTLVAGIVCTVCCYQDGRRDAFSLMQVALAVEAPSVADRKTAPTYNCTGCTDDNSGQPEQCIRFMHIPKTGGTSIDSANMNQCRKVFDSLALRTYQRIAKEMDPIEFALRFDSSLGCMFDYSFETILYQMTTWEDHHKQSYNWVQNPDGTSCVDILAAPSDSQEVADFFTEDGCTTFCAVRDPFQRFLSAYSMWGLGPCDPAGFNATVPSVIASLRENSRMDYCHLTPQVEMVYGVKNISLKTTQYCQVILHQENLNEEFTAFMEGLGPKITLGEEHNMGLSSYGEGACRVDAATAPQEAKDLIYEYYRGDYEAFGYARP